MAKRKTKRMNPYVKYFLEKLAPLPIVSASQARFGEQAWDAAIAVVKVALREVLLHDTDRNNVDRRLRALQVNPSFTVKRRKRWEEEK